MEGRRGEACQLQFEYATQAFSASKIFSTGFSDASDENILGLLLFVCVCERLCVCARVLSDILFILCSDWLAWPWHVRPCRGSGSGSFCFCFWSRHIIPKRALHMFVAYFFRPFHSHSHTRTHTHTKHIHIYMYMCKMVWKLCRRFKTRSMRNNRVKVARRAHSMRP